MISVKQFPIAIICLLSVCFQQLFTTAEVSGRKRQEKAFSNEIRTWRSISAPGKMSSMIKENVGNNPDTNLIEGQVISNSGLTLGHVVEEFKRNIETTSDIPTQTPVSDTGVINTANVIPTGAIQIDTEIRDQNDTKPVPLTFVESLTGETGTSPEPPKEEVISLPVNFTTGSTEMGLGLESSLASKVPEMTIPTDSTLTATSLNTTNEIKIINGSGLAKEKTEPLIGTESTDTKNVITSSDWKTEKIDPIEGFNNSVNISHASTVTSSSETSITTNSSEGSVMQLSNASELSVPAGEFATQIKSPDMIIDQLNNLTNAEDTINVAANQSIKSELNPMVDTISSNNNSTHFENLDVSLSTSPHPDHDSTEELITKPTAVSDIKSSEIKIDNDLQNHDVQLTSTTAKILEADTTVSEVKDISNISSVSSSNTDINTEGSSTEILAAVTPTELITAAPNVRESMTPTTILEESNAAILTTTVIPSTVSEPILNNSTGLSQIENSKAPSIILIDHIDSSFPSDDALNKITIQPTSNDTNTLLTNASESSDIIPSSNLSIGTNGTENPNSDVKNPSTIVSVSSLKTEINTEGSATDISTAASPTELITPSSNVHESESVTASTTVPSILEESNAAILTITTTAMSIIVSDTDASLPSVEALNKISTQHAIHDATTSLTNTSVGSSDINPSASLAIAANPNTEIKDISTISSVSSLKTENNTEESASEITSIPPTELTTPASNVHESMTPTTILEESNATVLTTTVIPSTDSEPILNNSSVLSQIENSTVTSITLINHNDSTLAIDEALNKTSIEHISNDVTEPPTNTSTSASSDITSLSTLAIAATGTENPNDNVTDISTISSVSSLNTEINTEGSATEKSAVIPPVIESITPGSNVHESMTPLTMVPSIFEEANAALLTSTLIPFTDPEPIISNSSVLPQIENSTTPSMIVMDHTDSSLPRDEALNKIVIKNISNDATASLTNTSATSDAIPPSNPAISATGTTPAPTVHESITPSTMVPSILEEAKTENNREESATEITSIPPTELTTPASNVHELMTPTTILEESNAAVLTTTVIPSTISEPIMNNSTGLSQIKNSTAPSIILVDHSDSSLPNEEALNKTTIQPSTNDATTSLTNTSESSNITPPSNIAIGTNGTEIPNKDTSISPTITTTEVHNNILITDSRPKSDDIGTQLTPSLNFVNETTTTLNPTTHSMNISDEDTELNGTNIALKTQGLISSTDLIKIIVESLHLPLTDIKSNSSSQIISTTPLSPISTDAILSNSTIVPISNGNGTEFMTMPEGKVPTTIASVSKDLETGYNEIDNSEAFVVATEATGSDLLSKSKPEATTILPHKQFENEEFVKLFEDSEPDNFKLVKPTPTHVKINKYLDFEDLLLAEGTTAGCLYEDRQRFQRNILATAYSMVDGIPTVLIFSRNSSCVAVFSKTGKRSVRSISSLLPKFPINWQVEAAGFINDKMYLMDSSPDQKVWTFFFNNQTHSYEGIPHLTFSKDAFLQFCDISKYPKDIHVTAFGQVSRVDHSCLVFHQTSSTPLMSANATKEAKSLAHAISFLLEKEFIPYVDSVFSWLDEPFITSVYIYGSNGELYRIFRDDYQGSLWKKGRYEILPYSAFPIPDKNITGVL